MKNAKPTLILVTLLASSGCWAQANPASQGVNYRDLARITEIQIMTQRVNQPQQVCNQAPAPQAKQQAQHGYGGALIGGVAGGLLGHTVGNGTGKDVATAGAAVLGALVGDHLQNQSSAQAAAPASGNAPRCYYVDNWVDRQSGAIVSYVWQGRNFSETLPYVPAYRVGDEVQLQVHAVLGARVQG